MSVKDLINAISSGSATETQEAFETVMAEKISARLEDMRVEVAQNMFKEEVEELDEAKDGWSKNDSLAKPVTSSQAMANHSQYFTKVTKLDSDGNPKKPEKSVKKEEVEELDELSKKTLGSYVKKATTSRNKMWKDMPKNKTSGYPEKTMSKIMNRNDSIRSAQDKLTK